MPLCGWQILSIRFTKCYVIYGEKADGALSLLFDMVWNRMEWNGMMTYKSFRSGVADTLRTLHAIENVIPFLFDGKQ